MSHMTQTANPVTLLVSLLGEEGHEVAKGVQANWIHRGAPRPANPVRRHPAKSVWTVVILIMILDVDVTAEGGIIKLIARKGDTTTLAAVGCVKLKNLKNLRGEAPSTLTPQACPKAKPPPQPSGRSPVNPHTEGVSKGREPFPLHPKGAALFRTLQILYYNKHII